MKYQIFIVLAIAICLFFLIEFPKRLFSKENVFKKAETGLATINAPDLLKIVTYLSSKELEGRLAGSAGYNKAAQYVADKFRQLGLKPMGEDGYFQHLNVEYNEIIAPAKLSLIKPDGSVKPFKLGEHFLARGFSGSGHFKAPVVFCGFGISSPKNDYDDYANIDVDGKIVMVFKPAPPWKPKGSGWANASYPRAKAIAAVQHGAVGMILVSPPDAKWMHKTIGSVHHGPGEQQINFPQVHLDSDEAELFIANSGISLSEIHKKIGSVKEPYSFATDCEAEIEIHAKYQKERKTMNVLGLLEGADPKLKDEVVILTAHLDHVGQQANEVYFPGANDNASGVASLLEAAEAFVENNVQPKRSVLFIAFAAEEQALNGSKYYAEHPAIQLNKTIAQLNIDCIGLGDSIRVGGGKDFPKIHAFAVQANNQYIKHKTKASGQGGGADAQPLYEKGIPTLYFATTNGYTHLHQITDTVETLEADLFEAAARLVYLTAWGLANSEKI